MEFIKAAPKQLARFVTFAALFAKNPRLALQPYETIDEATQPKVHGHSFFAALRALGVVLSR